MRESGHVPPFGRLAAWSHALGTVSMELFTGLMEDHTAAGHGASRERQFAVTRLHSATQFSCWFVEREG